MHIHGKIACRARTTATEGDGGDKEGHRENGGRLQSMGHRLDACFMLMMQHPNRYNKHSRKVIYFRFREVKSRKSVPSARCLHGVPLLQP